MADMPEAIHQWAQGYGRRLAERFLAGGKPDATVFMLDALNANPLARQLRDDVERAYRTTLELETGTGATSFRVARPR